MTKLPNPIIFSNQMCKIKKHIKFLSPLFLKPIKSYVQALFKENCQFWRQIEKSNTFQESIQIQALFRDCGNDAYGLTRLQWVNKDMTSLIASFFFHLMIAMKLNQIITSVINFLYKIQLNCWHHIPLYWYSLESLQIASKNIIELNFHLWTYCCRKTKLNR